MLRSKRIVFVMVGVLSMLIPASVQLNLPAKFSTQVLQNKTELPKVSAPKQKITDASFQDSGVPASDELQPLTRHTFHLKSPRKEINKKIPILMYHSISDNPGNLLCLSPQRFAEQMHYLKEAGYHPLTFRELADWEQDKPIPVKPIVITLDDGYRDNYTSAFPVLKQENLKATIFMTVGFFNGKNNLTEEMAKEMAASGLVEFGSHTLSHMDLTTLPSERLRQEIEDSKAQLESKLGTSVNAFCYPSGRYTDKVLEEVKHAGYRFAVTTKPGWADAAQGMWTLHRVRINGDMTLDHFKQIFP